MYPEQFEYHRAESVDHAVSLLEEYPGAELLAGGHSLLPTMKSRLAAPDHVVDIGRIDEMRGVDFEGDTVTVGALTTYATVAGDDVLRENAAVITKAAHAIGDTQVRNRGTVGGNIAHADPASDLPAAMLAADATVVAHGPDGERRIPIEAFFEGLYETALDEDELLTRIELPARPDVVGAYAKKASPSSGYAIVGVAVAVAVDGEVVDEARVAANGVVDRGVRLESVEDALVGTTLDDEHIEAAAAHAGEGLDEWIRMDDQQASAAFREQLLEVYTRRALTAVAEQTGKAVV